MIIKWITNWRIHLFLLYLNIYFSDSHSSKVALNQEHQHKPIDFCTDKEFRCENGHCIAQPFVCDGVQDCDDGSDETYNQCRNTSCDEQYFQCDYGACINKEYQCDGRAQCIDGSDEKIEECETIKSEHRRSKRAPSGWCTVPALSLDKTVSYNCPSNCDPSSGFVPNMTIAIVQCKPNFYSENEVPPPSVCFSGVWRGPIANCYKRCDKLNPINVNLRCTRNGERIPCDEISLIAGSKVRPTCRQLHRYADVVPPDYIEITCNQNGKWDKHLFYCVPECGRSYIEIPVPSNKNNNEGGQRLVGNGEFGERISGGVEERYGDAPWHVAIYDTRPVLLCGGTIIHQYIVLSAAHCFDVNNTIDKNPGNYEVVVSKVSRNYTARDNPYQKVYKIREIRASDKGYFGRTSSFTADIAMLILEEKIEISASVLPACVDWIALSQKTNPAEDTLGKVSGWGLTGVESGTYSEKLLTANLSFISRERCLRTVPDGFREYVTFDKFCAGAENGPSVLQGDSGGGFLFPQLSFQRQVFYYLRGIVSLKEPTVTPIAAFTDLADYYEWITSSRDEVERRMTSLSQQTSAGTSGELICNSYNVASILGTSGELICNSYNVSNCVMVQHCSIADVLIQSRKAIYCGYDGDNADTERICCKLPVLPETTTTPPTTTTRPPTTTTAPTTTTRPPTTTTQPPTTTTRPPTTTTLPPTSTTTIPPTIKPPPKASTESYKPVPRRPARTSAEIVSSYCDEYSKYATDCVDDAPQRGTRKPALLKEYPHHAYIGCESDEVNTYWTCEGSLISEWFVLSVAYCEIDGKGVAKWAHLGALISSTVKKENQAQIYDIETGYIHPNYAFPRHSIALYKLKRAVTFNSYIRPACLSTWQFVKKYSQLRMSSWGTSGIPSGETKDLRKGTITVVDDEECSNIRNYDSNSMACVGDETDGEALCLTTTGSPLLYSTGNTSCMWSIYAMWYGRLKLPQSCQNPGSVEPQQFTKVAYYLEWIQGIVWPTSASSPNTQEVSYVPVTKEPNKPAIALSPAEIASSYCERYSRYATDCVNDTPPRGTRRSALAKEYPHIAYIGCESDEEQTYWTCVGSLISERFVLSTAYCETDNKGKAKWVHLGALSRSTVKSETYDQMFDVERTYLHPDYDFPRHSIALYKLKTSVGFNSYIRPACVYTSNYNQINSNLRMTSWGTSTLSNGQTNDLRKGSITVVDDARCSNVRGYQSNSMACAGERSDGEALCLMSAGTPLQLSVGNTSCMWAIYAMWVSRTTPPESCQNPGNADPQQFTKVSYYVDWIQKIVWPTSESPPSQNTQQLSYATSRLPQYEMNVPSKQTSARSPAEIASSYCDSYSRYATECVGDAPPRKTRRRALAKEYPHIAYIGCASDKVRTYWTYNGVLISERFVLSTAYCNTEGKGEAKWVHLGAIIKSTVKSETYDKMYDVERSYVHPQYNFPGKSIALYKLKTAVEFNSYIRPACLYTSNLNQINSGLRIASWGTKIIPGANSDDLLKGVITVVDDQRCSSVTGYDSNSMACAGDASDGEALCLMSTGTPLQVLKRNTSCMWTIYAMHFGHVTLPQSCGNVGNATPQLFTKISHYLDWIQGIVWP